MLLLRNSVSKSVKFLDFFHTVAAFLRIEPFATFIYYKFSALDT